MTRFSDYLTGRLVIVGFHKPINLLNTTTELFTRPILSTATEQFAHELSFAVNYGTKHVKHLRKLHVISGYISIYLFTERESGGDINVC